MEYAERLAAEPLRSSASLPPIIVAGSSPAARARAVAQVEAAGFRLADAVGIEAAVGRIDDQAATSAVWVELDRDEGAPLDALLDRINRDADAGIYAGIVAGGASLIDPLLARVTSNRVEVLIDGAESERAAALALACSLRGSGTRVSDIAADNSAARLRQLSDEVGRIAATLARLSTGPEQRPGMPRAIAPAHADDQPVTEISRDLLRSIIRARRLRSRFFPEELFADPAWDMLLDLTQAELAQIRVPVSSLCIAAAVPATTALRWIKSLTDNGMLLRRADPHDGRRVFIEMAPATSQAMRRYFAEVGKPVTV